MDRSSCPEWTPPLPRVVLPTAAPRRQSRTRAEPRDRVSAKSKPTASRVPLSSSQLASISLPAWGAGTGEPRFSRHTSYNNRRDGRSTCSTPPLKRAQVVVAPAKVGFRPGFSPSFRRSGAVRVAAEEAVRIATVLLQRLGPKTEIRLARRVSLPLGLGPRECLLPRLSQRGFNRDFPSDLLGDQLGDHLRRFSDPLLGRLPHDEKEHKGDQHDYDQNQRAHQRDGSATHVLVSSLFAFLRLPTVSYGKEGRSPQ